MKSILTSAAMVTALCCGAALAQNTTPSSTNPNTAAPQTQAATASTQPTHVAKIAPGSVIPVQLTKTVDAKKVKTGDEVIAKVTQDMKTTTGEILVPKDAKVVGHVTQAQPRSKDQKESQVGIEFDRTETKSGEMQMPMSIQAIIGQQNNGANSSSGNEQPYSTPSAAPSSAPTGGMGGGSSQRSGMSEPTPPPTASPSATGGTPSEPQTNAKTNPPITTHTQGVVGISNLTLSSGPNGAQGSVVSSDKNNVKLESGTLMLLRVDR